MVLVPGIGCDTTQFGRLLPGLGGFDVHPLDLPGHHGTPALPAATLDAVAERVAGQVAEQVAGRVPGGAVLVGHSTGGVVGLVVAARHPGLLSGLVLLDANLPVTPDALARKVARSREVLAPGWREVLEDSMRTSWGPREPELREEVVAGVLATPGAAVRRLWHDVLALDPAPLLAALQVPALYVRPSREVDLAALHALNPRVRGADLHALAAGHWPHLTEPAAVLGALRAFLDGALPRG
nr:alpha/beta fold hydrolase [Kineococcus aurantiacus]